MAPGIDDPIAMIDDADNVTYFHDDGKGTIVALSDGTTGNTIDIFTHGPFGELDSNAGGSAYKFTARRIDEETGLYYYRNRYYHPKMGRFMSADPIGYGDGLNMYAYVGNDPVNYMDPLGLAGAEPTCTTGTHLKDKPCWTLGVSFDGSGAFFLSNLIGRGTGGGGGLGSRTSSSIVCTTELADDGEGTQEVCATTSFTQYFYLGTSNGSRTGINFDVGGIYARSNPYPEIVVTASRVQYTETVDCTPTVNGCGSGIFDVPEFEFAPACNVHDSCYGTYGADRLACDLQFLADMQAICDKVDATATAFDQWGQPINACISRAQTYYSGVRIFGGLAFSSAQRKLPSYCQIGGGW